MKQQSTHALIIVVSILVGLIASQSVAYASSPSVSGGGVVDGALGTTSQLGFNASWSSGGQFLCVMAGRSGGFGPFADWETILQMRVEGPVDAHSLTFASDGSAIFTGTATIHIVGKTSSGAVLTATLTDMGYTSWQTAGGAGVAQHKLEIAGLTFGPEYLRSGRITIRR
jgi:hypothetical protein